MEAIIETDALSRRFGKMLAVDGLDMRVERGEIFGLVGPDGAGKTTTIRMLAGIMEPTAGSARVLGFDVVSDAEAIKRRMGYMAQQFSLYGDLTVAENIDFYADIFALEGSEREATIERLLGFSQLSSFTKRRAADLSGGMQKKLALACALLHKPAVLILDEPTTGVDPVSRREFWEILTELHLQGVTILLSTPYMDEAERCSRVGMMYRGKLIVCDTPEHIKGMVSGVLIELRPAFSVADYGQALRDVRRVLSSSSDVQKVHIYGDLVRVFVEDAETGMNAVANALTSAGIAFTDLSETSPRMEDVFISLIRDAGAADPDAEALLLANDLSSR
jgi:ABC-2 type transport system ATP-binding protein